MTMMTIEANNSIGSYFVLRKIDTDHGCWVAQSKFWVGNFRLLEETVGGELPEESTAIEIVGSAYSAVVKNYALNMDVSAESGELERLASDSHFDQNTHTGRELLLMLAEKKPFAAFAEILPKERDFEVIPERYFHPYVKMGKIVSFEHISKVIGLGKRPLRRVLYALPSETWRFQSYLMMWRIAEKYGWNENLHRFEGYLLGYEPEIDVFFLKANFTRTVIT